MASKEEMDFEDQDEEQVDDWGDDWEGDDDDDDSAGQDDDSSKKKKSASASSSSSMMDVVERRSVFNVLDPRQIQERQSRVIEEVCDMLGISASDAAIVLHHYRWKKSKLIDDWVADSEKVQAKCGVKRASWPAKTAAPLPDSLCVVCTEYRTGAEMFAMECQHPFCTECWQNWLKAEMEKGPTAIFSLCPQHKCGETIPEAVFRRFLEPSSFERYIQYVIASFVQGASNIKWCPAPSCSRAIEYPAGGAQDVTCSCGNRFCFGCERVAHRPVPCDLVEKWMAKNASESENANWIMANTKVCPACKVPIEKNQGCNHMVCRMCKHEWCWLCKGAWSEHGSATGGFYNCNKYSEKMRQGQVDDEQKQMDKASNSLQRYLHYFARFDNHAKAVKFAEKTLAHTEARMKELQDLKGVGFMDVQFLLNAVTTVISCRHVLQWTYAYGFYLKESSEKALFETYQEQLEKFCEHLHELAEKPLSELQQIKLRTDVINYTRVTERYRDNIVRAIETNFTDA